jgi:DNA polymerase III alpha subunit
MAAPIKPIVGCEFYLVEDRTRNKFTRDEKDKRYHQLMMAKNANGYKNLIKLCSLGYTEGMYGKYPRIDKELVFKISPKFDCHYLLHWRRSTANYFAKRRGGGPQGF